MIRFALIGYGYRSKFYIRIAKALPNDFSIVGVYVTKEETKLEISNTEKLFATTNKEDILKLKPDFVVNTASKESIHNVSLEWISLGVKVLQETPLAMSLDALKSTWNDAHIKNNYQIAEQYHLYPVIESILKIIRSRVIGEVESVYLSAMHDYHAYSVLREIFHNHQLTDFKITGKKYSEEVTRTKTRDNQFSDGKVIQAKGSHVIFEWQDKRAVYDFSSEQYRSPIRHKHLIIKGTRGEIIDHEVYYLDDQNQVISQPIEVIKEGSEIIEIIFNKQRLYSQTACGLNEDEAAISKLLYKMKDFTLGKGEAYPLRYALEDSYVSLLMNDLDETHFKTVHSEKRDWMI